MAARLDKLKISKVALVKRGANPQADVLLYKSADPPVVAKGDEKPHTTAEMLQRAKFYDEWCRIRWALWDALESIVAHAQPEERGALFVQSVAEFMAQGGPLLEQLGMSETPEAQALYLAAQEVEKAGRVMAAERVKKLQDAIALLHAILADAIGSHMDEQPTEKGSRMPPTLEDVTKEKDAAEARAVAAEARVKELEAELAKQRMTPEEQEAEYMKSLPEPVRKRLEETEARAKAAEEAARIEKEARERQTYIEKTASYRQVGITPDHWNVLKAIDAMPEQERAELTRILASANEVIKQSKLFVPIGKDGSGDALTAWDRAERQALALVEKGEAQTKEQAIVKVFAADPELRRQYEAEKRGA